MGDMSLRKTGVEEKRAKVQKESKILLDYTRKAIARLTYLKRSVPMDTGCVNLGLLARILVYSWKSFW